MQDIIPLLSGGLIGGFLGAFLGGFAKFFWENWLPSQLTWRREQKTEREKLLSQFRAPAIRAVSELQGRVFAILKRDNYVYLKHIKNEDYYVTSTAYLIAAMFAWVEILRQRVGALDYADLAHKLFELTRSFSRGERGFQIFHLEQREIGERMLLPPADSGPLCLGYATFVEMMQGEQPPACFSQLSRNVEYLLENPLKEMIRLVAIQHALVDLIDFIDPDLRWVPQKERQKVDMAEHLKQLLDKKKLTQPKYEALEATARAAGLLPPLP